MSAGLCTSVSVVLTIYIKVLIIVMVIIIMAMILVLSGAVAEWLIMRTHNAGVVSSIPPCVTFKTPLVRKAMGSHLLNSTSLEKTHSPVSGSATLEIEYATQFIGPIAFCDSLALRT